MKDTIKSGFAKTIKLIVILFLIVFTLMCGALGVSIVGVLENTPHVEPSQIDELLSQTSEILDSSGNKIETIQTSEFRELITYDQIPKNLINAFIAIEDERFYEHNGVDPKGILSSVYDNLKSSNLRGASTLAQQLSRNIYLNSEQRIERKIKEAYLAIQLTESLGREGILEKYMNTVFLGQNAYGVQAASKTYFSKDVNDLTLAECAAIASIVKSPSNYALYRTILPEKVVEGDIVKGDIELNGTVYKVVYNDSAMDRQKHALKNMLDQGYISQEEYDEAMQEDIAAALNPGRNSTKQVISSYYSDLITKQVIEKLQTELNYTKDEAIAKYYNGGIRVYSAIDMEMQNQIEEIFTNFSTVVLQNSGSKRRPSFLNWSADRQGNITNLNGKVVYYRYENLFSGEDTIVLTPQEYEANSDDSVLIKSAKMGVYGNFLDPKDYFTVNDENNLVTHMVSASGKAVVEKDEVQQTENGILLSKEVLDKNSDLYTIDESGNLIFNSEYFSIDKEGIPQPQGSIVVIDHKTGQIKAVVGGRNQKGRMILNRATDVPRQPGSSIKPVSVYVPALDNGYTAATPIDDTPTYYKGELWPKNVYGYYKGLVSLRESLRDSINVTAVKTVEDVGIDKSKEYWEKFGLINKNDPTKDDYVSASENPQINDENASAMALGAMTYGVTNLDLTGAYAAIANHGQYIEPLSFTKIEDSKGNVILEDPSERRQVISPQLAYVITDIMKDVLTVPYGNVAYDPNNDLAGKTGTTQENQDVWFVGFSTHYTIGSWIGFDNQQLKLSQNGGQAVRLWRAVNKKVLEGKEPSKFVEPDGIVHMTVCTIGDAKPTKACYADHRGVVKNEIFVEGTQPTSYCKVHQFTSTGLKLVRPIPYDPGTSGIYPRDWNIFKTIEPEKEDEDDKDDKDDSNNNRNNNNNNNNNNTNTNNNNNNNNQGGTKPTQPPKQEQPPQNEDNEN
ncbi:penicillin-binding protein 1A [Mediannikoviicoccus vaginalis]|uniref:penicillin-binding protein 1A n=1 Tax=Mediannikoviicoccus vaginalis TaxID=2899727 RepID=UPI001F00D5AC|nr:PBP1A family penicillin-binding protein [Mediannikoviicoccus vaginalis]